MHHRLIGQHDAIQTHLRRLAGVIQLLAQPFGEFGVDIVGVDALIHALVDRHGEAQLPQIGVHGAGHVGVLQLAGHLLARFQNGAVHLAERGGGGGLLVEAGEV